MNYRLLAADMDGTTLNSQKEISPRTGEAIRQALRQGYEVVFSTGRNLVEMTEYLKLFPDMRYLIATSGSSVKDLRTGETLCGACLEPELVDRVLEAARGMDYTAVYFVGDDLYVDGAIRDRMDHYHIQDFRSLYDSCAIQMEDPHSIMAERPHEVRKVNLFFHHMEEHRRLGEVLGGIPVSIACGLANNYEISPLGVSKATGLRFLCRHLGLSPEQTIACGDEGNDREILMEAGLGIAMGNAAESILAVADIVVADCDHDGVAEAIETYLGKPVLKRSNTGGRI